MKIHGPVAGVILSALLGMFSELNALAAVSACDAAITKAAGKRAACTAGVYAKAFAKDTTPDPVKLVKCEVKFDAACTKAKSAADCTLQTQPCDAVENAIDACVSDVVENACSVVGGFCWFLGAPGASCTTTCAAEGLVYDAATTTFAGSGGTDENCTAVMDALGAPGTPAVEGTCVPAVDCQYNLDLGFRLRCSNVGGAATNTPAGDYQRACACTTSP